MIRHCPAESPIVADLTGGNEETQRAIIRIGKGMGLGVHAAFDSANQSAKIPLFIVSLDAARRVFRWDTSIITGSPQASSKGRPAVRRFAAHRRRALLPGAASPRQRVLSPSFVPLSRSHLSAGAYDALSGLGWPPPATSMLSRRECAGRHQHRVRTCCESAPIAFTLSSRLPKPAARRCVTLSVGHFVRREPAVTP